MHREVEELMIAQGQGPTIMGLKGVVAHKEGVSKSSSSRRGNYSRQ